MVVVTIILLLITMAIPIYQKQVIRSREAVLKNNLYTLRTTISQYMFDRHKAPKTLNDLVMGGFLKEVPVDPITGKSTTWRTIPEDPISIVDQDEPGIGDVKSGSTDIGLDGTRYATW